MRVLGASTSRVRDLFGYWRDWLLHGCTYVVADGHGVKRVYSYPTKVVHHKWGMEIVLREKGRITIPAQLREALGLQEGDKLEILIKRGAIILKPKQAVTAEEIRGIIGPIEVHLEEIEEAPGREVT